MEGKQQLARDMLTILNIHYTKHLELLTLYLLQNQVSLLFIQAPVTQSFIYYSDSFLT